MDKKHYFILAGIFMFLCLLLCGGVWYMISELYAYREEYEQLASENHSNNGIISSLETRNATLRRITHLHINSSTLVRDVVAFFSMVRQIMENRNISLLYITTSGQDGSGTKDSRLQIKINGGYYDMLGMLADLRNLPVPSKITRLSLKRNHDLPERLVEADLTIEVLTEE
ncbi:MAG: hypothetical protein IKQ95_04620 [Synergistaceae bacterium]|nr:hypothetical protein [Synergistaceae bacterium]